MEPTSLEEAMQSLLEKAESNPQALADMFNDNRKKRMDSLLETFEKEFSGVISEKNLKFSKDRIREVFKNINPLKDMLKLPKSLREIFDKEYAYFQGEILNKPTFPKVLLVAIINDFLKFLTPSRYSIDPEVLFKKEELEKFKSTLSNERQKAEDSMEELPQEKLSMTIKTICKRLRKSNLFSPSTIQITHLLLNDLPDISKPLHGNSMPIDRGIFLNQLRFKAMVSYIELAPKHHLGKKMADLEKRTLPYSNKKIIGEITTVLNNDPLVSTPSPISENQVYGYIRDIFDPEYFIH